MESTRTSGAPQSFRLELSDITPTSSSTPFTTSIRAGNSVAANPTRIPFQTLLDELQVAEATAIEVDMMDMEDVGEEEGEGSQNSFIDDEEAEPSETDWSEQEDTGVTTEEIVGISTMDSDAFNDKTKAASKTKKLKAKQGAKDKIKDTIKRSDGAERNTTTISIGNSSAIICNACKTPFTTKSGYSRHVCKPSGSKPNMDLTVLKCSDEKCSRIFTNNSALTRHQQRAHGESSSKDVSTTSKKSDDSKIKFQCEHCPSTYVKECNLKRHVTSKHEMSVSKSSGHEPGQDTVQIPDSQEQLKHVENLPQDPRFACDKCDAKYIKEINLRKHKESKHASDTVGEVVQASQTGDNQPISEGSQPLLQEKFSCDKCDTTFEKEGTLKKHVETKHAERVPVLKRRRSIEAHKTKASAKTVRRA